MIMDFISKSKKKKTKYPNGDNWQNSGFIVTMGNLIQKLKTTEYK